MLKLAGIVHEEAALTKRLLEEIELKQASSQYYDTLLEFLKTLCNEVLELTNNVLAYLKVTAIPNPKHEETLRNWLVLGSFVVRHINSYCDSFEYAEVLSVPSAIMQLLNRLFRKVAKRKEFMVKGTTDFNYAYQPIGASLNKLASYLALDTKIRLEDSFAVLKFPLAYGKSVMANCNLVHELGHLIVDSTDLTNKLDGILTVTKKKQITDIIENQARLPGQQYDFDFAKRKVMINKILGNWIHESMADHIGLVLLGPCTLLAFMKLIEPKASHQRDDDEHPCDSLRIDMMLEILTSLGWDKVIQQECPEFLARAIHIGKLGRKPNQTYDYDAAAMCLPIIKEDIFEVANKLCRRFAYKPQKFLSVKDTVYGLLERGIPPAEKMTIGTGMDEVINVDAISILNTGWFFYEKGYPSWEERFSKFEPNEKVDFLNRLLAKAIEVTFVKEASD